MLGAPDGRLTVDQDLAFQDAGEALIEGRLAGLALLGIDEGIAGIVFHLTDEFHDADHRVVVKGNVPMVLLTERIILGPAAMRVLRNEYMSEPLVERLAIGLGLGRVEYAGQET
jgi:hypothetical protein